MYNNSAGSTVSIITDALHGLSTLSTKVYASPIPPATLRRWYCLSIQIKTKDLGIIQFFKPLFIYSLAVLLIQYELVKKKTVKSSRIRLGRGGCRVSQLLLVATPRVVREPRMSSTCRAPGKKLLPTSADPRLEANKAHPKPTDAATEPPSVSALPSSFSLSLAAAAALTLQSGGWSHGGEERVVSAARAASLLASLLLKALRSADRWRRGGGAPHGTADSARWYGSSVAHSRSSSHPLHSRGARLLLFVVWLADFLRKRVLESRVEPTDSVRARCSRFCGLHLLGF